MSKHSAPSDSLSWGIWSSRYRYAALRDCYNHPGMLQLLRAARGREAVQRTLDVFEAHDAWENEGGALAYVHR